MQNNAGVVGAAMAAAGLSGATGGRLTGRFLTG
jgi:hypothetical protein